MNHKNNTFHALRSYLALWFSQSISSIGTAMTSYALTVWTYGQNGTASSVSLLTLTSFMPTILFRFAAGAAADRWNKKAIMLAADLSAACGSLAILLLYASGALTTGYLYVINLLLSLMNAFQVPAAYVATSQLVPKEYYSRIGGLQAASDAAISILSPALGGIVVAWGGLSAVLLIDLTTFGFALAALQFIPIPKPVRNHGTRAESFWQNSMGGVRYLLKQPAVLKLVLYIAAVNFLAKLGADGQMSAFVLSRADQHALGAVQTCIALGLLCGGIIMSARKPSQNPTEAIFASCCCIFAAGIGLALCAGAAGWCVFAFLQYLCAAVMNVHWNTMMRASVPLELQGRVYSARDTLQNCTIPLGLYLGGALIDQVFEPLMSAQGSVQNMLRILFGTGLGSGAALLFFLTSVLGLAISLPGLVSLHAGFFRKSS